MRILLVEDDEMLSIVVAKGLAKLSYAVDLAMSGTEALYNYEINQYDVIILDLNIPEIDGIDVLKKIRENDKETKIIILSARSKINDRVIGLNEGADDYLVKPFDFMELEARIQNLLRRKYIKEDTIIKCLELSINNATKQVFFKDEIIDLTKKEYAILECLMQSKPNIVSAEALIEHVWDSEFDPFSGALRFHLHSLKKKISQHSTHEYIKTIRGVGYKMEETNEETNE